MLLRKWNIEVKQKINTGSYGYLLTRDFMFNVNQLLLGCHQLIKAISRDLNI